MAWLQQQHQLILRLPDDLAKTSRKLMYKDKNKSGMSVSVRPQDPSAPSNDFIFTYNGEDYPALLMNLPTPLETHKTFDNKIFLKSGDIGQVLQVFHTAEEKESMRNSICKTIHGDYMPSGMTPPTADIVKRRFEKTRKKDGNFIPYRIRAVAEEINKFGHGGGGSGRMVNATTGEPVDDHNIGAGGDSSGNGSALEVLSETITEEVVEFEEWMIDRLALEGHHLRRGVTINMHRSQLGSAKELISAENPHAQELLLLFNNPDMLVTEEEREEDDIDRLAAEQLKEQREQRRITQSASSESGAMDVAAESSTSPSSTNANSGTTSSTSGPLKFTLGMLRPSGQSAGVGNVTAQDAEDEDMVKDDEGDVGNVDENSEEVQGEGEGEEEEELGEEEEDDDDDEDGGNNFEGEGRKDEGMRARDGGISPHRINQNNNAFINVTASAMGAQRSAELVLEDQRDNGNSADYDQPSDADRQGRDQQQQQQHVVKGDDESSVNSDDSDAWMRVV